MFNTITSRFEDKAFGARHIVPVRHSWRNSEQALGIGGILECGNHSFSQGCNLELVSVSKYSKPAGWLRLPRQRVLRSLRTVHSVTPESRGERILEGTSREGLRSQ